MAHHTARSCGVLPLIRVQWVEVVPRKKWPRRAVARTRRRRSASIGRRATGGNTLAGGLRLLHGSEPEDSAWVDPRRDGPVTRAVTHEPLEGVSRSRNYRGRVHIFDRAESLYRHVNPLRARISLPRASSRLRGTASCDVRSMRSYFCYPGPADPHMPLPSGAKLGPYEVLSRLGAGGMGEVYRARDTRLDRTVAIKVLPEHLARDPSLRQRFEREARAVSSLNHAHICVLHDIGRQDGIDYLVLEYLEGESLHDRLAKGPLPLEQALRYATQIADALDKAHRTGVVHRDLKPGNVMLTKSGAKLLDFGLASVAKPVIAGDADLSDLATPWKPLTGAGTLLGTIPYMAPEQIEGHEADSRTDIWALGAILYEMLTGQRAFIATSPASLIGTILKDDPKPI